MPRRVGWLALVLATSGWSFLWFAIRSANTFCGGGPDDCPSLLGEAPRFVAVLGMLVPTIAISVVLGRHRVGPRFMRFAAIVLSSLAVATALAMTVAAYDFMLSSISSGRLDAPYRAPAMPAVVGRLGDLWPLFSGGWMALTSVQLVRIGVPLAIAGLGVLAGFAIVLTLPYATEWFVITSMFPAELILSLVWALSVGAYLLAAGSGGRMRMSSWTKRPSDRRSPNA